MNVTTIDIDGEALEMLPDTVVATKIKRIDIGEIQKRFFSHTNTFRLPKSENNLLRLGFPDSENSISSKPYSFQPCVQKQNGIEVIPNAKLNIRSVDEFINVVVYDSLVDYFSAIKGKKLSDVNPIAESAWTASGIDSARSNTSGIVTAVMSWGRSTIYEVNYFLPCFYYHSIVRSILEFTGLELEGDILTDARFTDLVIPFPGGQFQYPESAINSMYFSATESGTQTETNVVISDYRIIGFSVEQYDNGDNYDGVNAYTVPKSSTLSVHIEISVTTLTLNDASELIITILKNGVPDGTISTVTTPSTQTLDYTGNYAAGDVLQVAIHSDSVGVGADFETSAAVFTVTPTTTVNRNSVIWNDLWPDINCDDIIKDFFNRFALIPNIVGGKLILKSLEDIIKDRANAIDWSDKLVKSQKVIDFSLGYAQENTFTYSKGEDVTDESLGKGSIDIASEVLKETKNIYKTVFENSILVLLGSAYRVARIPVYTLASTGITDFDQEPGLRLLTLKSRTNETGITFNAINRTDYKLAYFVDPSQTKDTGWAYFKTQFYTSLEQVLQKNKTIKKQYRLTELDIAKLSPHKIVWDGEGYYIVDEIPKFIPGRITDVEQFKVG